MRIAKLDLLAFGPFTDRALDFSRGAPGGLHLLYGKNAAGKSSALRAISDLLFGFPGKSNDDHIHPYSALRLRATLESSDGQSLVIQRLKRNKDSLRDQADAPLDEIIVKRLLGSVDRAMFERVFGLDHERLRDAGLALLAGGGDVGESLFDAGAGGQGVRRVIDSLREEAERLFKPRGGKQEIVQLVASYRAARDRVRDSAHAPEAYQGQRAELERLARERDALARELSETRREREQARILQGALKGVARRERLLSELRGLGELSELAIDLGQQGQRVQTSLSNHQANLVRIEREIEQIQKRAAELKLPGGLLEVDQEILTRLREGIGSVKKALADLPERESELKERRTEAQVAGRRLGIDPEEWSVDARARRPLAGRFKKLMAEHARLLERCRGARDRERQSSLDCETRRAQLDALPEALEDELLEQAVLLAQSVGDLEGALLVARRERAENQLLCQAELAVLAPFNGTLAELCTLRVPASETIERFEQSFVELEERARHTREELARNHARASELSRELAAEERAGAVPSEPELLRTRQVRDDQFEELLKAWPESSKKLSLFEAARVREYRALSSQADALADRLRREAARVAENARRTVELAQLHREREELDQRLISVANEKTTLEQDWAGSWAAAGFEPVRPAEMRGWMARRDRAVQLVVKEAEIVDRERQLLQTRKQLAEALEAGLGSLPEDLPLALGVERAKEKLDRARQLADRRKLLRAQLTELEVGSQGAMRERASSEKDLESHDQELREVIRSLGFDDGIEPEEVEARLQELNDLAQAQGTTRDLERRIAGMQRDIAAFEAEVLALVTAHAPELSELSATRAAAELVSRYDRGRRDAETLQGLLADLGDKQVELAEERALLDRATNEAQKLLRGAGVTELTQLFTLDERARKSRELRRELAGLEATLSETAGIRGFNALCEEAARTDPAQLAVRIGELDDTIERLEEREEDCIRDHQRVQGGLERFSDTSAVEAAEEERALASAVISRSERWAKLKLAEVLLTREIERYREQNQGPVLRRASELFARLTQSEFSGLRVGREERVIVAVRSQGQAEVPVSGLNEAARYHLYLALRLASLERHVAHTEPLPFVLDDILIHFDDDAVIAALGVLEELSTRVQVLLFTHHRHNLALAARAVPQERLFVHEL